MNKQATSAPALTYVERRIADRGSLPTVKQARAIYAEFRRSLGYSGAAALLTSPDAQPKLGKSVTPTFGLMLAPHTAVNALTMDDEYAGPVTFGEAFRRVNLCPMASAGCASACLNTAGKGRLSTVQRARATRTAFLIAHPAEFVALLIHEIAAARATFGTIRVRLNVVSDVRWELCLSELFEIFNTTRFYDYTAWSVARRSDANLPANYSLTRSAKEVHTVADIRAMIATGATVAVPMNVKRGAALPAAWHGMRVIDGDASDDRTLDPRGVIVGLRAKGDAIGDASGFVRDAWPDGVIAGTLA